MTNQEFQEIRESLGLTRKELATKLDITPLLLGRYEKGSSTIPEAVAKKIEEMVTPRQTDEDLDVPTLVKKIRESLDLSLGAFGQLLGVSRTAISNYESGRSKPKEEVLKRIKELAASGAGAALDLPDPLAGLETVASDKKKGRKQPMIFVQSQFGGTISQEEVLNRIPSDAESVYIKPADNKAYWVRGKENGSVNLW